MLITTTKINIIIKTAVAITNYKMTKKNKNRAVAITKFKLSLMKKDRCSNKLLIIIIKKKSHLALFLKF